MAAKLTPKENFTKMVNGEIPESVPIYTMGMKFPGGPPPPTHGVGPYMGRFGRMMERAAKEGAFNPPDPNAREVDEWGVTWVGNREGTGGMLPEPNNFILKDIRDWKKVLKAPPPLDTSDSWWRDKAKHDEDISGIDRNQSLAALSNLFSPFTTFISFMGFNEGLCAMYEEPEEVKELLNWMLDYYMPATEKAAQFYKGDLFGMGDDTATKYNPFFSVEMYRDIFKPVYSRLAKPYTSRGLFVEFHNCGRCEDFVPDMIDFGVKAWDPAQTENDLVTIKKTRDISICGGYDFVPPGSGEVTEEYVRETVRKTFRKLAPGGRFCFGGGILSSIGDTTAAQWNMWARNEVALQADCWYAKN